MLMIPSGLTEQSFLQFRGFFDVVKGFKMNQFGVAADSTGSRAGGIEQQGVKGFSGKVLKIVKTGGRY